jgi:hypothetical protein
MNVDPQVKARQNLERRIAKAFIADMLAAGLIISVCDGEAFPLKNSSDPKAIIGAMFSTDEDVLHVKDPTSNKNLGWAQFIYGNGGYDVIADYTVNLEPYMIKTNAAIEKSEAEVFKFHR